MSWRHSVDNQLLPSPILISLITTFILIEPLDMLTYSSCLIGTSLIAHLYHYPKVNVYVCIWHRFHWQSRQLWIRLQTHLDLFFGRKDAKAWTHILYTKSMEHTNVQLNITYSTSKWWPTHTYILSPLRFLCRGTTNVSSSWWHVVSCYKPC